MILVSRQDYMVPFRNDFQIHIAVLHHTDLLLSSQQSLVK